MTSFFREVFCIAHRLTHMSRNGRIAVAVDLSGSAVYRSDHLPSGAAYDTFAASSVIDTGVALFTIDPSLLSDGESVLAVELHHELSNGTNASFDSQLAAVSVPEPPTRAPATLDQMRLGIVTGRRPNPLA